MTLGANRFAIAAGSNEVLHVLHPRLRYPGLWRGCVGAWAPCLGPGGLRLQDNSGYGRHGTLTNMTASTAWTAVGGVFALNMNPVATNESVRVDSLATYMAGRTNWSVSFWAAAASYDANRTAFAMSNSTFIAGDEFNIYPYDTSGGNGSRVYFNGSNIMSTVTSTANADGRLHHFCFVSRNATDHELFVNGKSVANSSSSKTLTANIVRGYFGNTVWDGHYIGQLTGLLFWNRAVTASESSILARRPGIAYERSPRRSHWTAAAPVQTQNHMMLLGVGP